jgi:hypothetical protein
LAIARLAAANADRTTSSLADPAVVLELIENRQRLR